MFIPKFGRTLCFRPKLQTPSIYHLEQFSKTISTNFTFQSKMNLDVTSNNETVAMEISNVPTKNSNLIKRIDKITKSEQDTREYRGIHLENGLKAMLISDPKTDVSAAAMSVQVGHMSDPVELMGLSHFCEHMLFLGTEKYPNENAYNTYLSQNGGSSNAATYPLMTRYHFHVAPDKLEGALDRFAQFFIAPLFTASATDRELNAVHSEHEKNLSSDIWRIKQLHRHLAKPDHPFSKFGSGNKDTLYHNPKQKNIDVRQELLNFHQRWYSANIMNLAVIGKESLDELESMVIGQFSEIKNSNVAIPEWPKDPFSEDRYETKLYIMPIKDVRTLNLSFTTPDLIKYYKSAPESYLTHLLGHESKGSILSELRSLGWCNDLMAGHQSTLNGYGFFEIVVDLTKEGVDHIDDIISHIFQYLQMLRDVGPQKWIFEECRKINEMRFRFKDKEQPEYLVTNIVSAMQTYPIDEVLTAPYMNNEWRPDLISSLLEDLQPNRSRIILLGQHYKPKVNQTEPYYGTEFGIESIDKNILQKWKTCGNNEKLALPQPNDFIPKNFDLKPLDDDISRFPQMILDTPIMRVWHKQDDQFFKPKSVMTFDLANPIAYSDPINSNLNHLLVLLIKDQLSEYLYDADLAGLKLQVSAKSTGIEFSIRGYSDKQVVLLEKLMDVIFNFYIDEKRFNIIREQYIRQLGNFKAEQPYQHVIYYLALILTENSWSNSELIDAVELVTYPRLIAYGNTFFQRFHAESFIYGNVTKAFALEIAHIFNSRLEATNAKILPLLARQLIKKREYKLSAGDSYVFQTENAFHKSSCVELYFQCGFQTDFTNIMVNLVAQMMSEPCYDSLRTKEQLGYIVLSGTRKVNSANGIRIIVQSVRHPSMVEKRIESFIEKFMNILEEMTEDEFEKHKTALAQKKLEKAKSIFQRFSEFYNEISMGQYHFERNESEVAILKSITKQDVINYVGKHITHGGSERRVLAVHIVSTQFGNSEIEEENAVGGIDHHCPIADLVTFKSSKELFSICKPHLDIMTKGARSKL